MIQYRVTFENSVGKLFIAVTAANTQHEAVNQVRESISDYGRTVTVEGQDIRTVTII